MSYSDVEMEKLLIGEWKIAERGGTSRALLKSDRTFVLTTEHLNSSLGSLLENLGPGGVVKGNWSINNGKLYAVMKSTPNSPANKLFGVGYLITRLAGVFGAAFDPGVALDSVITHDHIRFIRQGNRNKEINWYRL